MRPLTSRISAPGPGASLAPISSTRPFEKAIAANANYVEARHSYGLVLALMHAYGKARVQLQEALRLAPDSAEIRSDLEDVQRSLH